MSREINLPNFLQARPIKNFKGRLARKVYGGRWEANTERLLNRRIESKMEEFDTNFVESLLETS